jgi:serine/threonine protein kinase
MGAESDLNYGPWETGLLLAHRYRVKQCLQRSASCEMYRVQDAFRGVLHLVVRPSSRTLLQEGGAAWFEQYCKTALSMPAHPNLLPCNRMDWAGRVPFMVMPDVDGNCWDEEINAGNVRNLNQMLDVALQVARGIAWFHANGYVHGNIKPANVLLTTTRVAKIWKYPQPDARTRAYASPEQIAGEAVGPATDIWSWAVSVLHMFMGKAAWPSGLEAPAALQRYKRRGPAVQGIPLMPGAAAELLSRCLAARPRERPASMDEVISTLRKVQESTATAPPAQPAVTKAPPVVQAAPQPAQEAPVQASPVPAEEAAVQASPLAGRAGDPAASDGNGDNGQGANGSDAEGEQRPRRWTARRDQNASQRPRPRGTGRRLHSS